MKHTLIIMMGIPGGGKSTAAKIIKESHEDCVIVSRDAIRFAMLKKGEDYFAHEDEVEQAFYNALSRMLEVHRYVIADATHVSKRSRTRLYHFVKHGKDVEVIGVWVDVKLSNAIARNSVRKGLSFVPPKAIAQMYNKRCYPEEYERFDRIIDIDNNKTIEEIREELENI